MRQESEERLVRCLGAEGSGLELLAIGAGRVWSPPAPWREVEWESSGEADVLEKVGLRGRAKLRQAGQGMERGVGR
jgi:hypothetical protein